MHEDPHPVPLVHMRGESSFHVSFITIPPRLSCRISPCTCRCQSLALWAILVPERRHWSTWWRGSTTSPAHGPDRWD